MQVKPLEELALLPLPEAVERRADESNHGVWQRLLRLAMAASALVLAPMLLARQSWLSLATTLLGLAAAWALLRLDRLGRLEASFRQVTVSTVVGLLVVFLLGDPLTGTGLVIAAFALPVAAAALRLRTSETLTLFSVFLGAAALATLLEGLVGVGGWRPGLLLGQVLWGAAWLAIALRGNRRFRGGFEAEWRREAARVREQQRMRQELDYARTIQLSMLPRSAPEVDWLDLAGVSVPANEVGGDYYDYLPLGEGRLAVVVGDVAGHGVASGLLLSGIRACLYLLRDQVGSPPAMLGQLHRMVRQVSDHRMLVSLLYGVLDRNRRSFEFSVAGHPAPLHWSAATGQVQEVEASGLPLGTRLTGDFPLRSVTWAPGDVLLLSTDGIAETRNAAGEEYGYDRLLGSLSRAAATGVDARMVREGLLLDLWGFKGATPQADDVTMVVVRPRQRRSVAPAPG